MGRNVHKKGGRHARRPPYGRAANGIRADVVDRSDIAAALQRENRGWLIIWSKWRQMFTAFACTTTEALIIDDADFDRLRNRIRQVDHAPRRSRLVGGAIG